MPAGVLDSIQSLWGLTPVKQKKVFYKLAGLIVLAAIAEVLSVIAVIPFVQVINGPAEVQSNQVVGYAVELLEIKNPMELQLFVVISFVAVVIAATLFRLMLLRYSAYAAFSTGAIFSTNLYRNTLMRSYEDHVSSNTSDDINSIVSKNNTVIYGVVAPLCNFLSALVIGSTIVAGLVYVDPITSFFIFFSFLGLYLIIGLSSKTMLATNSKIIAKESTNVIQALQEGLGSIRDVIIENSYDTFIKIYRNSDIPLRQAQASSVVISQSPRFLLEGLGMSVIACVALYYLIYKPGDSALTTLTVFALGSQRLLPVLQQAYMSWSNIVGSSQSLSDVVTKLNESQNEADKWDGRNIRSLGRIFRESLEFNKVSFSYSSSGKRVIDNVSFKLSCGDRVGLIGPSGCGKSTAVDIIMGLLPPSEGQVLIDGKPLLKNNEREWHSLIAHVPQRVFIADNSIKANIAFATEDQDIDNEKLKVAIAVAELDSVINNLPDKENTLLGENGARLSGGQIQRVGIARAIYKRAPILIMDEATSALDNDTERRVIKNIMELPEKITLIMVAHRLNTLARCDYCLKFERGGVSYCDAPSI